MHVYAYICYASGVGASFKQQVDDLESAVASSLMQWSPPIMTVSEDAHGNAADPSFDVA